MTDVIMSWVGNISSDLARSQDMDKLFGRMQECVSPKGGEVKARHNTMSLGNLYLHLSDVGKARFLRMLNDQFSSSREDVSRKISEYVNNSNAELEEKLKSELISVLLSPRLAILRQFMSLSEGVKFLVDMRADVVTLIRKDNVQALLDGSIPKKDPADAKVAVFYSISNTQVGLSGINLGNFLIKRVVERLSDEFRNIKTYVTLSPVPGFVHWLKSLTRDEAVILQKLGITQTLSEVQSLVGKVNKYESFAPPITQFHFPIATGGHITLDECSNKDVRISRIHLEQDAGKSIHVGDKTYIDFNRAGVALMEIVSEPDLRSPEEAAEYIKKLRMILRAIGTCDGDMESGSLRCDANVSVRKVGESKLGARSEIKNLNSIKYLTQAIKYEARRQVEVLENAGVVSQSTMLFDADTGTTRTTREKEDACDYRYFPDPDLLPLELTKAFIDNIRASLPELPSEKRDRYMRDIGLSRYDADILSSDKDVSTYFECVVAKHTPDLAVPWITGELFGALNKRGLSITDSPVSAERLVGLLDLIADGTISGKIAKQVFALMFETEKSAPDIVREQGLRQITSEEALAPIVDRIIAENPAEVAEYRQGKGKLLGYFVGKVMKETGGQANPGLVNALIKRRLSGD
ncbi:hypothetical protein GH714_042616 [Hevea brasiliensis]|uniref:Glutamyl-tRNA(Gln) amidotransferase subunit B, chloroplastic/mitochondrial n=1 Tax=Hevea brasiliensis TaxID=3981 RepID=A0A6A6JYX7_HEVBR|nr:hypothetical protein GH714_042616 [Hevea brasiliensis]